jgi:hypothetical protein
MVKSLSEGEVSLVRKSPMKKTLYIDMDNVGMADSAVLGGPVQPATDTVTR